MHERLSKLNDLNKATAALYHLAIITRGGIRDTKSIIMTWTKIYVFIPFRIHVETSNCNNFSETGKEDINQFNTSYFISCPKLRHEFLSTYAVIFLVFNDLMWENVVLFVDIHWLFDYHCLALPFLSKDFIIIDEPDVCNSRNALCVCKLYSYVIISKYHMKLNFLILSY